MEMRGRRGRGRKRRRMKFRMTAQFHYEAAHKGDT